jgi:hypothetical protein
MFCSELLFMQNGYQWSSGDKPEQVFNIKRNLYIHHFFVQNFYNSWMRRMFEILPIEVLLMMWLTIKILNNILSSICECRYKTSFTIGDESFRNFTKLITQQQTSKIVIGQIFCTLKSGFYWLSLTSFTESVW